MLFTENSRFSLENDTRSVLIWRKKGSRNNPPYVCKWSLYRRNDLMVLAGISIGGCTDLRITRNGTLKAQKYRDEILTETLCYNLRCSYRRLQPSQPFVFQNGNARTLKARLVENMLKLKKLIVWNDLHALLTWIWLSMEDAFLREQGLLLLSENWKLHFMISGTISPKVINNMIASMENSCCSILSF